MHYPICKWILKLLDIDENGLIKLLLLLSGGFNLFKFNRYKKYLGRYIITLDTFKEINTVSLKMLGTSAF